VKFDASLHKQFTVRENVKLDFRFDAFNVFNHTNWTSFNSNDVLTALGLSFDPNCTNCQRLNARSPAIMARLCISQTCVRAKVSKDFTNPTFGGLGDPAAMMLQGDSNSHSTFASNRARVQTKRRAFGPAF